VELTLWSLLLPSLLMLDWTTSFLSDETIINPTVQFCQIFLSDYYIWCCGDITNARCGQKEAPHYCGALTKTKPNGGNSRTSDMNVSTVES
jgi:hypothetical protein